MKPVPSQPEEATCSFCLRPANEVATLVRGPGVYICTECVRTCSEILAGGASPASGQVPWERQLSDEELLAQLPRLAAVGAQAEAAIGELVRKGRAQGVTWTRIGAALGMTRQSAWERFSGEE